MFHGSILKAENDYCLISTTLKLSISNLYLPNFHDMQL